MASWLSLEFLQTSSIIWIWSISRIIKMYNLPEVVLVDDSVTRKRRRWSGRLQPRRGFVWLAPSADCNVTIPVAISSDFHHWLLSPHWLSETHTPIQTRTLSAATRQDLLFDFISYLLNRLLCHLPFTPGASRWKRHRHVLIGEIKALLLF